MRLSEAVVKVFSGERREDGDDAETTFSAASDWLKKRVNLPTPMKSREISKKWDARIRAQAFYSARVAEPRVLSGIRKAADAFSRGEIERAEARTMLKRIAHDAGLDDRTSGLRNLGSLARIDLILSQNAAMAAAVGQYQAGMDPDIKERFQCWRYVGTTSITPRDDHARYVGHVYSKDDPIWHTIFPPSAFGCKCSVEDCDDPPEHAPKDVAPSPDGFAFDPAHAFETFDLSGIEDAVTRTQITADMRDRFGAEEMPDGTLQIGGSNRERRKEQREKAAQKRVDAFRDGLRSQGMGDVGVKAMMEFYTTETAKHGRAPNIVFGDADVKRTELSPDGRTLIIKRGATLEEMRKAVGNLGHKLDRARQRAIAMRNRAVREAQKIGAPMIKGVHSREQDLKATNPNWDPRKNGIWEYNCQRCVTAYEARRRGIDVVAMPRPIGTDRLSFSKGWAEAYHGGQPINCSSSSGLTAKNKIIKAMQDMPDGSRCAVQVLWRYGGGDGHVFIAEKQSGKTIFVDPQRTGDVLQNNASPHFDDANGREVFIMRLDNLKFSDIVKQCCKGATK